MARLESGFEFEISMTIQEIGPVILKGSYPDCVHILSPALSPEQAQKICKALQLALDESRVSLAMKTVT